MLMTTCRKAVYIIIQQIHCIAKKNRIFVTKALYYIEEYPSNNFSRSIFLLLPTSTSHSFILSNLPPISSVTLFIRCILCTIVCAFLISLVTLTSISRSIFLDAPTDSLFANYESSVVLSPLPYTFFFPILKGVHHHKVFV